MRWPDWHWPFPRRRKSDNHEDDGEAGLLHPVVLVPGIGGSILNAVNNKTGKKERIWVRVLNADREFRTKLWSKFNPATGRSESLDAGSHIEVPEDNFGLYSCDILDPDLKIPLDMVTYYHSMIVEMRKWGYVDGKTLFGFGYDFRQSNRLAETLERLKGRVRQARDAGGGRRVDIISHSMGGLIVKLLAGLEPEFFEEHVRKWVTIATPFHGAPGFIMDTLLTGVEFVKGWEKDLFIAKWTMHQLLVECPSVFELMADYEFEWERTPELRIVRLAPPAPGDGPGGDGEAKLVVERHKQRHRVLAVLEEALRKNAVTVGGATVPLQLSWDVVGVADKTREILNSTKLPESVHFYSIYGTSLDTPHHTCYGSEASPIKQLEEILHTTAAFECVDGDGTVPVESSMGDGLDAKWRIGVPGEHRALLRDPRVFRIVRHFLHAERPDPDYDPSTDFVLVPPAKEVEASMAASCAAAAPICVVPSEEGASPRVDPVDAGAGSTSVSCQVAEAEAEVDVAIVTNQGTEAEAMAEARVKMQAQEESTPGVGEAPGTSSLSGSGVAQAPSSEAAEDVLLAALTSAVEKLLSFKAPELRLI